MRLNISTVHQPSNGESYLELDSHADTCVIGSNALLVETAHPERTAIVSFADPSVGSVTKPIISGAFLYTSPTNGSNYILVVHQAVYIETMQHSLLCPMQLRDNDIILNETPKSMIENPTEDDHTLAGHTDENRHIRIPFRLKGVTSCITVSKPTQSQYEELPRLVLTNQDLQWDPQSTDFQTQEDAFLDTFGNFKSPGERKQNSKFILKTTKTKEISIAALKSLQQQAYYRSQSDSILDSICPSLNEGTFGHQMTENRMIHSTTTSTRRGLSPAKLAKTWNIPLKQAENTIRVTTQRGVRHIANPAISRRFRTNDRMMRYRKTGHTVFTDTLKSTVISRRQNTHAQVYCTDFGWTRAYPMEKESQAHHTLSKFFKDVGVPNKMVMDGAKAQVLGKFRSKIREVDCHIHQTEPHTPFTNRCESEIGILKKMTGRALTSSRSPK